MSANPNHPRFVEIPAHATFRAEEGAGFRVYIVSIPGKGETCIEVAWSAVAAFEECVVGRVLGQEKPADPEPRLLADGVWRRDAKPVPGAPRLEWVRLSDTWFESGPWTVAWSATLRDDDGGFARWEGWYLQGPRTPEFGAPLGVGDEAPLRAAEAWIHEHRRVPEAFPGERAAWRMLRRGRESAVNPVLPDVADPAGGDV